MLIGLYNNKACLHFHIQKGMTLGLNLKALIPDDAVLHPAEQYKCQNNNYANMYGILLKRCNVLCVRTHIKKKTNKQM